MRPPYEPHCFLDYLRCVEPVVGQVVLEALPGERRERHVSQTTDIATLTWFQDFFVLA